MEVFLKPPPLNSISWSLADGFFYTRNAGTNSHIWRFRAPLYIAEVNDDFNLVRSSEQIVFPMIPEGDKAAGMGNFHPAKLDERRAIVTVGEERYFQEYHGDTLCAMLQL